MLTVENISEYTDKLRALFATTENTKLLKGLDFTIQHLVEYDSDDFTQEMIDNFLKHANVVASKDRNFFSKEDKGYSGNKTKGKMYDNVKDLSIKEITDLIRTELKIEFPDFKFSVKSDRNSIGVSIVDLPYNPYSELYDKYYKKEITNDQLRDYDNRGYGDISNIRHNARFQKDMKKIKEIRNQYNFDDSDSQTDYFHVNYYGDASLDDYAMKNKFYSEYNEEERKRNEEYDRKREERNRLAREEKEKISGGFKKGDKIIYTYTAPKTGRIPSGEYPGVITKVPNGRSKYSSTIEISWVYGNVKYNANIYDISKLKKAE
jgi:hypothetical protein